MKPIFLLPWLLIAITAQASCGADWVNISGTVTWSKAESIPERPVVDVSKFTSHVPDDPNEVKEFGWIIDPDSRGVASVVVFVRNPKRIHPDFPQDIDETRRAFSSFFQRNVGAPLDAIKSVNDVPAGSSLEAVPSLVVLNNLGCQPMSLAIRAGQPVVVLNKDSVVYSLRFFDRPHVFHFCKPKEIKSHYFSDVSTRNAVGCTIHSWMNLPVSVFDHPYFDTSDSQGRFCISRVPAGEIELCALFWKYSIDLGSGQITYADLKKSRLKLIAKSDSDLGTIVLRGWPPQQDSKAR